FIFFIFMVIMAPAYVYSDTDTPTATPTPSASPTFTCTPETQAAYFQVQAPSSAQAGEPIYITVTAITSGGTQCYGYDGIIDISTSSTVSELPAEYTFMPADNGTKIFEIKLMTAGDQTVDIADIYGKTSGGTTMLTVNAGQPDYFTVAAPSTAKAGEAFYITVTAKDSYNNVSTKYLGAVSFSSTDSMAVLPDDSTFIADDGGKKILACTLKSKGAQTVSAVAVFDASVSGSSNMISVTAGKLARFNVSAPANANPGTEFNFAVTAVDGYNNAADGYTGTVHFTSTDSGAVLPANYSFSAGNYGSGVFTATLNNAGNMTISVNDAAATTITGTSANIAVSTATDPYSQPLMLTSYLSTANKYQFVYILLNSPSAKIIPVNAFLEYDVYIPPDSASFYTGIDFAGSVLGNFRDFGQATQNYLIDQNGIRCHPSMDLSGRANGRWYHRKIDIGATGGMTYIETSLAQDTGNSELNGAPSNNAGTFNAVFDNLTFKNSSGTVLTNIFTNNSTIPHNNGTMVDGNISANMGDGGISTNDATHAAPLNNYIWIIKNLSLSSTPGGGVTADGLHSYTVTAHVSAPGTTSVAFALVDFASDRIQDIVVPVKVSLNTKAITDWNGNARACITSTKSGTANITVGSGHMQKIITLNFSAGPATKAAVIPSYISAVTGVQSSFNVRLEDKYGNFASDARGMTLVSNSPTMLFSSDNGVSWQTTLTVSGNSERSVLVVDSEPNTAVITVAAPGVATAYGTIYINNSPSVSLIAAPQADNAAAGTAKIFTVASLDYAGNNSHYTGAVTITSASSTMRFSTNGKDYGSSIVRNMVDGRLDIYCYDTVAASNVTVTVASSGLTPAVLYRTTVASTPAMLDGWPDRYSVVAGQSVTITAKITDAFGNPVAGRFITFTAQVQNGNGDSVLTPSGNSTNAQGVVTVVFRTKSTEAAYNYCIMNAVGLLGKTVTISAADPAGAVLYSFQPKPMSLGADKSAVLYISSKDSGGYNSPAPTNHNNVFVYTVMPAGNTGVAFSSNGGMNWYTGVTITLDSAGMGQVLLKSHFPGTYYLKGIDTNSIGSLTPAGTTLTVSTAYYARVLPVTGQSAPAGTTVTAGVQIVDQNGNSVNLQGVRVDFSTNLGSVSPSIAYTDVYGRASTSLTLSINAYAQHLVTATIYNPDDVKTSA
ncbi:MAG: Ig-like domain-containing protein, partial [Spirochaetia bacterium]|nr:Ig-like domain-containing protein [Spirochaetia bacterium]